MPGLLSFQMFIHEQERVALNNPWNKRFKKHPDFTMNNNVAV